MHKRNSRKKSSRIYSAYRRHSKAKMPENVFNRILWVRSNRSIWRRVKSGFVATFAMQIYHQADGDSGMVSFGYGNLSVWRLFVAGRDRLAHRRSPSGRLREANLHDAAYGESTWPLSTSVWISMQRQISSPWMSFGSTDRIFPGLLCLWSDRIPRSWMLFPARIPLGIPMVWAGSRFSIKDEMIYVGCGWCWMLLTGCDVTQSRCLKFDYSCADLGARFLEGPGSHNWSGAGRIIPATFRDTLPMWVGLIDILLIFPVQVCIRTWMCLMIDGLLSYVLSLTGLLLWLCSTNVLAVLFLSSAKNTDFFLLWFGSKQCTL